MTKPATVQLRTAARPSPAAAEVPEPGEGRGKPPWSLTVELTGAREPSEPRPQAWAWPREGGLSPLCVWPPIKVSPPSPGHAFLRDSLRGCVWGLTGWNWGWAKGTGH